MATALIIRRRSALYRLAEELYVKHRPDAGGWCPRCERLGCPARSAAAEVVRAAGTDPALLDSPPRRPDAAPWAAQPPANLPVHQHSHGGVR